MPYRNGSGVTRKPDMCMDFGGSAPVRPMTWAGENGPLLGIASMGGDYYRRSCRRFSAGSISMVTLRCLVSAGARLQGKRPH